MSRGRPKLTEEERELRKAIQETIHLRGEEAKRFSEKKKEAASTLGFDLSNPQFVQFLLNRLQLDSKEFF